MAVDISTMTAAYGGVLREDGTKINAGDAIAPGSVKDCWQGNATTGGAAVHAALTCKALRIYNLDPAIIIYYGGAAGQYCPIYPGTDSGFIPTGDASLLYIKSASGTPAYSAIAL